MPRQRFPNQPIRWHEPPGRRVSLAGLGAGGIAAMIGGVFAAIAVAFAVLLRTRRRRAGQSASSSDSKGSGSDRA